MPDSGAKIESDFWRGLRGRIPSEIKQVISPRAYLIGGTLKLQDLVRYALLPGGGKSVTRAYEKHVADYLNVKAAVSYSTGRAAMSELFRALDIRAGDEIIIPGYTCIAVPAAIMMVGAIPKYVDIDARTFNIDPSLIERSITPRTRVIVAQHTFGIPCDLDALQSIASRHGLLLIEDCAHAAGAKFSNRYCGNFGTAAYFSTEHSKMFSTVKGGFVTTNDTALAARLRRAQATLVPEPPERVRACVERWTTEVLVYDSRVGSLAKLAVEKAGRSERLGAAIRGAREFDLAEFADLNEAVLRPPAQLAPELARIGLFQVGRIEADVV